MEERWTQVCEQWRGPFLKVGMNSQSQTCIWEVLWRYYNFWMVKNFNTWSWPLILLQGRVKKKKSPVHQTFTFQFRRELQWKQHTSVRIAERCLQSLLMVSSFFELLYSTCADVLISVPFLMREASAVANAWMSCGLLVRLSFTTAIIMSSIFCRSFTHQKKKHKKVTY